MVGHRRLSGGDVDGRQRARDGRDGLHRGADAQQFAGGQTALGAAGAAGGAPDALGGGDDLVVRLRAGHAGELEAVADLDALDGLDAHEGGGEAGVEPAVPVDVRAEADRDAVGEDLDDAAEGVAVLVGLVDLRDHRLAGVCVEAAHRVGVEPVDVGRGRVDAVRGLGRGQFDHVGDDLDARDLLDEGAGDGAEGDAGGGLTGAGALQDRPGLVEAVLLHAREVGVAGARTGQRRVAAGFLEQRGVDRVGRHDGLPLGPLGVADHDRDRAALGQPVADAAEEGDLVLLELHAGTAAIAEPAPGQVIGHQLGGDRDAGGKALQRRDQCRSVRLSCGQPTQPAQRCSSCSRLVLRRRDRVRGPDPPHPNPPTSGGVPRAPVQLSDAPLVSGPGWGARGAR